METECDLQAEKFRCEHQEKKLLDSLSLSLSLSRQLYFVWLRKSNKDSSKLKFFEFMSVSVTWRVKAPFTKKESTVSIFFSETEQSVRTDSPIHIPLGPVTTPRTFIVK